MTSIKEGNRDLYFKGQQNDEELICFFRHHWISLVKNIIYFAIIIITSILLITYLDRIQEILRGKMELKLFFLVVFSFFTFFIHWSFINLLNHFINIGIITSIRIIDHQKSLFFRDSIDAIDMAQIQNMEQVEDGVLPSLLGYGDLRIYLNASSSVRVFKGMPNIKFHFRCIGRQKEERQKEGGFLAHSREQQV